ncbi:hypothetical protein KGQ34_01435, partial [Patescibacteria group bacterium]|nr:hypothetical protein [Patescibacteria group bacterium]
MNNFGNSKQWILKPPAPEEFFGIVRTANQREFTNSRLIGQLLWNRGLRDGKSIERFFDFNYERDTDDPF